MTMLILVFISYSHKHDPARGLECPNPRQDGTFHYTSTTEWIHKLTDNEPGVRLRAVKELAKMGPDKWPIVPALLELVRKEPDPSVRLSLPLALGNLDARALPTVKRALKDPNSRVRLRAVLILHR